MTKKFEWRLVLGWTLVIVLAPIWLPLHAYHTIRNEIIARRYFRKQDWPQRLADMDEGWNIFRFREKE